MNTTIGERIKLYAKQKGMTLDELSKASDVPVQTLYGITKKNGAIPKEHTLFKLANTLGIPFAELKFGNETSITQPNSLLPEESTEENTSIHSFSEETPQSSDLSTTDKKSILDIDYEEFIESLRKKKKEISDLQKNPPGNLPEEALKCIIDRKEDEIQLLLDYYDLSSTYRLYLKKYLKKLLTTQRLIGISDDTDPETLDPNDIDLEPQAHLY